MVPEKKYMLEAIRMAQLGKSEGDYGIGAVVVKNGEIIVATNSRSKRDNTPIAHAETLAVLEASKTLGTRHLIGCVLYSTHEPCPMCTGAAVFAKMDAIVCGARIEDMNEFRSNHSIKEFAWTTINISCENIVKNSSHEMEVHKDFLREECVKLFHDK